MSEDYIRVLQESLDKKIDLLERIVVRNEQQKQMFESDDTSPDELDANIAAKGSLVDQIVALDDGFERLFERVSQELQNDRERYSSQIKEMQDQIRRITDLSARIEGQEQRNRNLAVAFFAGRKSKVKTVRKGTQAAAQYYRSMMRFNAFGSPFDTRE